VDWLVLGIFCVLFAALLVPGALRDARRARRGRVARGAREVREQLASIFRGEHELAPAGPRDFPDLDRRFYDRAQAELAAHGFTHLADLEDRTLNAATPHQRTLIRCLLGDSGTTIAAVSHLRVGGLRRMLSHLLRLPCDIRVVELTSLCADGVFLLTNNVAGHARLPFPPQFRFEAHPSFTTVARLVARHRTRVDERGADVERHAGLAQVLATIARQWREAGAFFRGRGGLRREEWYALSGSASRSADELYDELRR